MDNNEFICDAAIMVKFIQRLTEATQCHKVLWHRNDSNAYYVTSSNGWIRDTSALNKLSIVFTFDKETDATRIYIDDLYKTYTPEDEEVWKHLKALEWEVSECIRSIEATLQSMMDALDNM